MSQIILAPDEAWIDYLARMWLLGSQLAQEVLDEEMDGSTDDLGRLQRIIDSGRISADSTQALQALGIVFGKVFVNESPGWDWWVVEDDYGKDACVRFMETTLLAFPQTMISNRVEDGEAVHIAGLYAGLTRQLEEIRLAHYAAH